MKTFNWTRDKETVLPDKIKHFCEICCFSTCTDKRQAVQLCHKKYLAVFLLLADILSLFITIV